MEIAADELLDELARIDATLQLAVRRAGQGCGPEFERRLQAHLRRLRSMLGADDIAVANDTMEAAHRVMISADPAAPLLMGFSAIGLFTGQDMLRKRARIAGRPLWWREEHYAAMLGNGVATHIAFLGLGLPRLLPMIDGTALHYVAWFGPLVVAIVAKPLLDRRFAARATTAPGRALATTH